MAEDRRPGVCGRGRVRIPDRTEEKPDHHRNGENVSPEELENKLGESRLVQEVLVREDEGVIQAVIYPDPDYVKKKRIRDVEGELQKLIDAYNEKAPVYKRIYSLVVREREFDKTTSKKIKRY